MPQPPFLISQVDRDGQTSCSNYVPAVIVLLSKLRPGLHLAYFFSVNWNHIRTQFSGSVKQGLSLNYMFSVLFQHKLESY